MHPSRGRTDAPKVYVCRWFKRNPCGPRTTRQELSERARLDCPSPDHPAASREEPHRTPSQNRWNKQRLVRRTPRSPRGPASGSRVVLFRLCLNRNTIRTGPPPGFPARLLFIHRFSVIYLHPLGGVHARIICASRHLSCKSGRPLQPASQNTEWQPKIKKKFRDSFNNGMILHFFSRIYG